MSTTSAQKLEDAFADFVAAAPHTDRVWAAYGRFEENRGNLDTAVEIYRRGLGYRPFSQELHYSLGKLLLDLGDASAAVSEFEQALAMDLQDNFQHDVAQDALIGLFAQALEADGQQDRAVDLYQRLAGQRNHLGSFSQSRLTMISALTGASDQPSPQDFLNILQAMQKGSHDEEEPFEPPQDQ